MSDLLEVPCDKCDHWLRYHSKGAGGVCAVCGCEGWSNKVAADAALIEELAKAVMELIEANKRCPECGEGAYLHEGAGWDCPLAALLAKVKKEK